MGILEFLAVWKDYGVAGLFLALYLLTVKLFYRELKERQSEIVRMTDRYATNLDQSTTALNRSTATMEMVARGLEESRNQTAQFIAFAKGRDAGKAGV